MTQTAPSLPDTQDWWEHQAQGPILHPSQLRDDPIMALGAALFHIGMASGQYGIITDQAGRDTGSPTSLEQRFTWAEADARKAHQMLHHVSESGIAYRHELGPELRKAARAANFLLTQERQAAAALLGITPPPQATDHIQSDQLDHTESGLDDQGEAQAENLRLVIDESQGYPIALLVCLKCQKPLMDTAQGDDAIQLDLACRHDNSTPPPDYLELPPGEDPLADLSPEATE